MITLSDMFSRDEQLRIVAMQLAIEASKGERVQTTYLKRSAESMLDYIKTGTTR